VLPLIKCLETLESCSHHQPDTGGPFGQPLL
jgi:hypothetical protein